MHFEPTEQYNIVIVGHVDHGKSTVIGRLLADTNALPEGKLRQIEEFCRRNARPFEYAFLLDSLKDERQQGITIDSAKVFFNSETRKYRVIDAPGHIEFLKNMITGADQAEAALLVIDAKEGIQENSRRHGYILSMLGIQHISVLINKMDLIDYDQATFDQLARDYQAFLAKIGMNCESFVPISGMCGDNIIGPSANIPWYDGPSVMEVLESFPAPNAEASQHLRLPVQGVYRFTRGDDDRRIVAGTILSGEVGIGDELVFYPSHKKSTVKTLEAFQADPPTVGEAGDAIGLTLTDQIYIGRGEIACQTSSPPLQVSQTMQASLFWLAQQSLDIGHTYRLKIGSQEVDAQVTSIQGIIDSTNLDDCQTSATLAQFQIAKCTVETKVPIAFDLHEEFSINSRFVLVGEDHVIAGGGIITENLGDHHGSLATKVRKREEKWFHTDIDQAERAKRLGQRPHVYVISGPQEVDKKSFAKQAESALFSAGKLPYVLGMANLLYGVDADLRDKKGDRREHFRRLGEIGHLLLDLGTILLITVTNLEGEDQTILNTVLAGADASYVWIGKSAPASGHWDLKLSQSAEDLDSFLHLAIEHQG